VKRGILLTISITLLSRVNLICSVDRFHVSSSVFPLTKTSSPISVHQCTSVYISVHQCTSVYISVHQCTSVYISVHV